ncbi:hypothetical protein OJF2_02910 [Aquisphaera giovannonii]|uniref:Ice-binding protein C-terminal domain-containing protein n=1 Tax=Aquisphaera giovannonii TaxID=406548 RepID=A0A5B9VTJ1_9BACT|nr:PEP-CTERM sorting domain-containing protein [Aquisphaera giovannonii]QEH31826.1 hypothetical protein OJF2_02910 [Aquisphaera giovannonii]
MKRPARLLWFLILALASPIARGGSFTDDFSSGLNPAYWTVAQTTPGLFTVDTTQGNVHLSRTNSTISGFQYVKISLNLAEAAGQAAIAGDFTARIDFSGAMLAGNGDVQAEFQSLFQDGSGLFDNRSNDPMPGTTAPTENVHVWNFDGNLHGYTPVTSDSGTFTIARAGSTLAGYFDNTLLFSETNASPLTDISFVLQNYSGRDPIAITFDNFSLTTAVPEPSSATLLGIGIVAAGRCVERRRRQSRRRPARSRTSAAR